MPALKKTAFSGRIVVFGCGTIGQCALPMLFEAFETAAERITVVEADDHSDFLAPWREAGLHYLVRRVTPDNLAQVAGEVAKAGDLLLNLSVGIDSITLSDWCHLNGVLYVDTAIEPWEADVWDFDKPTSARTEYGYHQRARRTAAARWSPDGPTAVITHGANPGLVSHFVKAALLDIAAAMRLAADVPKTRRAWALLASATGTRVIHIAERDTQVANPPKRPGEFVNTWSIPGFVEEASMPVELGWGTHEKTLPPDGARHEEGPGNAIFLRRPGGQTLLRSWVPLGGPILGLALPHNESITLSDYLTLEQDGAVVYRPTVAFAYLACDGAMASLHETIMTGWRIPEAQRVLNTEILEGRDELGVLLLGHGLIGWWYGSQLDIHEARRLVPNNNPTAIQVAAGALAGAVWTARNPARGFCEPEDLPHDEVLATARPYLGPMVSLPTDWTPLRDRGAPFPEPWLDPDDPWQVTNFLVR
jgi:homospermidine synthase